MTPTNRILLNTSATYTRALVSLLLGLFSVRWVLAALGKSDFGLFGVVGGIVVLVQLLNIVMSNAVSRCYAYAIGETERGMPTDRVYDFMKGWFNAAVSIHFVLPILLVAVGYPIGIWTIGNWLVIPPERISACYWVFRLVLIGSFASMISVPYIAMFNAWQLIAEVTCWDLIRSVLLFFGALLLMHLQCDRLVAYAFIMTISPIAIMSILVSRARKRFPYCRIDPNLLFNWEKLKIVGTFGLSDMFSSFGVVARDHGATFIINKLFGPIVNSAYSIANQLSAQANTLANSMQGALMPAVTTLEGAGKHQRAILLSHRSCKFCSLLVLLFAIPLFAEVDEVLRLWLVNPPQYASSLCRCVLASMVCAKLGLGYHLSILAKGKVMKYQFTLGMISYLTLPIMYVLAIYQGVVGIGYALIANSIMLSVTRVTYAHFLVNVSIAFWFFKIVLPIFFVIALSGALCLIPTFIFEQSFMRICFTSCLLIFSLASLSYAFVLDSEERKFIVEKIWAAKRRLFN